MTTHTSTMRLVRSPNPNTIAMAPKSIIPAPQFIIMPIDIPPLDETSALVDRPADGVRRTSQLSVETERELRGAGERLRGRLGNLQRSARPMRGRRGGKD